MPTDGTALLNNQPTFEWSDVSNADQLQRPDIQEFHFHPVGNECHGGPTHLYAIAYLPAGKTLYWRVRAKLAAGYGQWSATYSIHTALPPSTPKLVKPANNALTTTIHLCWIGPIPAFPAEPQPSTITFSRWQRTRPSQMQPRYP